MLSDRIEYAYYVLYQYTHYIRYLCIMFVQVVPIPNSNPFRNNL